MLHMTTADGQMVAAASSRDLDYEVPAAASRGAARTQRVGADGTLLQAPSNPCKTPSRTNSAMPASGGTGRAAQDAEMMSHLDRPPTTRGDVRAADVIETAPPQAAQTPGSSQQGCLHQMGIGRAR